MPFENTCSLGRRSIDRTDDPLLESKGVFRVNFNAMSLLCKWLVDVAGIEPAAPCLQSKRKFNLSRRFGCAYQFQALLRLLQTCSNSVIRLRPRGRFSFRSFRSVWRRPRTNSLCYSHVLTLALFDCWTSFWFEGDPLIFTPCPVSDGPRAQLPAQDLSNVGIGCRNDHLSR